MGHGDFAASAGKVVLYRGMLHMSETLFLGSSIVLQSLLFGASARPRSMSDAVSHSIETVVLAVPAMMI